MDEIKLSKQAADAIKRKLYELARNDFITGSMLYQEMESYLNSFISKDELECGCQWLSHNEIAKRSFRKWVIERSPIGIPPFLASLQREYFSWLDQKEGKEEEEDD